MQFEQTITLNLNAVGQVAYCLKYANAVSNLPPGSGELTAWQGWLDTAGDNHDPSVPLPTDVAVPCWARYVLNGVNLGHVFWWVPGKGFYSSPYSTSKTVLYQQGTNTHAVLPSIAVVERIYSCTFVGWSEYISGEQVVKQGGDMNLRDSTIVDAEDNRQLFLLVLKRNPYTNNGENTRYVGWKFADAFTDIAQNQDNTSGADGRGGLDTMAQAYYANSSKIPDGQTPTKATVLDYVTKNLQ